MGRNSPDIREDGLRELREIRLRRGLSQADLSAMTGVAEFTISEIESGKRANPRPSTLRKLAQGLGVEVTDLYGELDSPLRVAPPSSTQPPLNGFEEERRTAWESGVENARRLREIGQARMAELLSAWRASKERQEDRAERREYLDEMGDLLQRSYGAWSDLFGNFAGAPPAPPPAQARRAGGEANYVPDANWEEVTEADRFYYRLRGMVEGAGLFVRQGSNQNELEILEDAA